MELVRSGMGVDAVVQDMFGEPEEDLFVDDEVVNGRDLLPQLLPHIDDESYCCLRFIDWYSDTIFNQAQMRVVIPELDRLIEATASPEGKALLRRIRQLAVQVRDEPNLYLRFMGD